MFVICKFWFFINFFIAHDDNKIYVSLYLQ